MTSSSQPTRGRLHILFIRHGETQDNIDKILQGLRDTKLTEKGHEEARVLATKLQDHPDAQVHADQDLVGQSLGELEGGSYGLVDMSNPRSADGQPDVECFDDYVRRLKKTFARIIGEEVPQVGQKDRTVVVATHGVGITSLFKTLEASPPCDCFGTKVAVRGPQAHEVRWTDSDDIAELVVAQPEYIPIRDSLLDWERIAGQPFLIDSWGKEEKAIQHR